MVTSPARETNTPNHTRGKTMSDTTGWEDVQITEVSASDSGGKRTVYMAGEINGVPGKCLIDAGSDLYRALMRALQGIAIQAVDAGDWTPVEMD